MPGPTAQHSNAMRSIESHLPNVVRDIRDANNLTQQELAESCGLSPLFVLRSEQFLHVSLSPALSVRLSELDPQERDADTISTAYVKGRNALLAVNADFLAKNPYLRTRIRAALNYAIDHGLNSDQAKAMEVGDARFHHPFTLFRTHLFTSFDLPVSQIKFCAFTGVHPTVLSNLESYRTTLDVAVTEALKHVLGLHDNEIQTLKLMCDQAL